MKKILIYVTIFFTILFPITVFATNETTVTSTENNQQIKIVGKTNEVIKSDGKEIDFSKPIAVSIVGCKDIDTFTVRYQNTEFDITLFGIDIVTNLKTETEELNNFDKEIFNRLLRSKTLILERDEENNLYNKNGEIQVWVWADNKLFQNELISDGYARLDMELCKYSTCEKYYNILYENQGKAQKSLSGIWGAKEYTLNYNIGGNKRMFNLSDSQMLFIGGIFAICLAVLIIIAFLVISLKKNKSNKKLEEKIDELKGDMERIENNTIGTKQEEIENKKDEINVSDSVEENNETNKSVEDYYNEPKYNYSNKEEIKEQETTQAAVENYVKFPELKDVSSKDKDILLNIVPTLFNPKDPRAKEVPETIKVEMVLVDADLKSEKFSWFVKPMKFPKLSPFCKERSDVTQIDINNGVLFEDIINNLIPLFNEADKIYSWGKGCYLQFEKEGFEKLTEQKYKELMEIINNKYVNYKEDFAERNEETPCSLVKAADMSDQKKEKDAVDTMLNIYNAERM